MTIHKGDKRVNGSFGEKEFLQRIAEMDKDWPNRQGERNGHAKLSELQVRLIRGYQNMPIKTAKKLADICGIHYLYVYHLRSKKTGKWAHLK